METNFNRKMIKWCLIFNYLLFVLSGNVQSQLRSDLSCPENCQCLGNYVACVNGNLTAVPNLPLWVEHL